MKIRGERECRACGTRWSYFETGSVGCPACGSLRSVGTDDPETHTDQVVSFDLTTVRADVDTLERDELAQTARDVCRQYVRRRGFVRGGVLGELDDTYLAAVELAHVADVIARTYRLRPDEELYFLSLLRGADDGERPGPDAVPATLTDARASAYADAIEAYRRDIRTWIGTRTLEPEARGCLELLGEHETRLQLLTAVDPETTERLLEATRDLADGLRGDEVALARARERLEALD